MCNQISQEQLEKAYKMNVPIQVMNNTFHHDAILIRRQLNMYCANE